MSVLMQQADPDFQAQAVMPDGLIQEISLLPPPFSLGMVEFMPVQLPIN